MTETNTLITILYRDGCNYKAVEEVVVMGYDEDLIDRIKATLDEGEWFIPEQVCLPRPRFREFGDWNDDDDHPWCEIDFEPTTRHISHGDILSLVTFYFENAEWDPFAAEEHLRAGEW